MRITHCYGDGCNRIADVPFDDDEVSGVWFCSRHQHAGRHLMPCSFRTSNERPGLPSDIHVSFATVRGVAVLFTCPSCKKTSRVQANNVDSDLVIGCLHCDYKYEASVRLVLK